MIFKIIKHILVHKGISKQPLRSMSAFVSSVNPLTGKAEWIVQDEDYDFQQEVARSAYADMLHDTERNKKYDSALREAINEMHRRGKVAHVLDIGTGSGLLSMMAVRSGADQVTACEAFTPMAVCAKEVLTSNNVAHKVRLVPKRSTELIVGPGGDMEQRANILVTEVFDTELIGEGAIGTFSHAHAELLEEDCIVVPSSATMYAQVIQSDFVKAWNKFQPIKVPGCDDIIPPAEVTRCPGSAGVHDLQLDQLSEDQFTAITNPIEVFRFDYTGRSPINASGHSKAVVEALASGSCDAVFMWWDLTMDHQGHTTLSCAPRWAHPEPDDMQWRDHWMQAIYYPSTTLSVEKGQEFCLLSNHDDYSLWFDVTTATSNTLCTLLVWLSALGVVWADRSLQSLPPVCHCGAHVVCSRTRIAQLHDKERNNQYIQSLAKLVTPNTVCMHIGDQSFLPLVVARLGAKHVYCLESHPLARRMMRDFIAANKLQSRVTVMDKLPEELTLADVKGRKASLLLGEPFFSSCTLPWHNIFFWYARSDLSSLLEAKDPVILPVSASIMAIGVEFKDLWKIRSPLDICEGFDLSSFDQLIQSATDKADDNVEPQPLWEYPGIGLTDKFKLAHFDFKKTITGIRMIERKGVTEFVSAGCVNGVAIWMDFHLDEETTVSTGLLHPPTQGALLKWDPYTRQGVNILPKPITVSPALSDSQADKLKYSFSFKPSTGEMKFEFYIAKS